MQLVDLLDKAKAGYPDETLGDYYDPQTGELNPHGSGDTLAKFVVVELIETFNPERSGMLQIEEAKSVIRTAMLELSCVYDALKL